MTILLNIKVRGGFFVGIPNPTKKIPIPGMLNPMGFLPKRVGSQSREFPGIFERDLGYVEKYLEKNVPFCMIPSYEI